MAAVKPPSVEFIEFHHDFNPYEESCYRQFKYNSQLYIVYLEEDKICFMENSSPMTTKVSESIDRWMKEVRTDNCISNYKFSSVLKRLNQSNKKIVRKNCDLREFRVMNQIFLVKRFFSFGLLQVEMDQKHIIGTFNKPLDLYIPSTVPCMIPEYSLNEALLSSCIKYTIPSYMSVHLEYPLQYVIIAPIKCFFFQCKESVCV